MIRQYILEGKRIVRVPLLVWARWMESHRGERIVAKTNVGRFLVSTVFLGLDHGWGNGPPILWETMVFKGELAMPEDAGDLDMDRCAGSWEQAEEMHERMVKTLEGALGLSRDTTSTPETPGFESKCGAP